ncbi:hypothetical protein GCM10010923_13400 [Blastomonas marina]|uniref:Metal-dependent hydrolase n=1 Tax=Blastomonas marina TaxID=1867408 RepID=A0ABQ1FBE3_9SPHN|nr:metal-dependent hydrolase [Blastomonas marina]GGA05070.1 hypothetical protein GCM10010923_13400 [Blastomonas marina]
MDNLTHSLVGAVIGQAGLKRKTGLAMPALIIGANLPDVDAACFLWLEGAEHLGFRRGITHGPIAWVLLPLVLAGLLYGWDRWQARRGKRPEGRLPVHFGWLYALSFIGCLTHPVLDWLNVYGIRLLEPFSSRWFYGDVLFIIDVWLWAILGIGLWLSLRREKHGGDWRKAGQVAMAAAVAYIGTNAIITWHAENVRGANFDQAIASPVPLAFWERELIIPNSGVLDERPPLILSQTIIDGVLGSTEQPPAFDASQCGTASVPASDSEVSAFLFWSRVPFLECDESGRIVVRDARYYHPSARGRFSVLLAKSQSERLIPTDPSS